MGTLPKMLGLFLCCLFLHTKNIIGSDAQRLALLNTGAPARHLATKLGNNAHQTKFGATPLAQRPRRKREIVDISKQEPKGFFAKLCGYCCCK